MGNCIDFTRSTRSKLQSTPSSSPQPIQFTVTNPSASTPSSSGVSSASSSSASAVPTRSTNENNNPRLQYVAIFDYDARTKEDLTIRKSDLLEITNKSNQAWWKAKNESGHEGWIPSNYVAKRDSLESEPYVLIEMRTHRSISFVSRWYFKALRRIDAEKQLMSDVNEHGSFLVTCG
jgi:hypothetical protein